MKVAILAGGLGTRLREETEFRPKPMVEIGGRPVLWHIMRHYASYDFRDFVLCLGYKGEVIRNWIMNFHVMNSDVKVRLGSHEVEVLDPPREETNWTVTLAETGANTPTGGRLVKARRHLGNETFMATYGDGVSNVDLRALLAFHKKQGRAVTVTGVRPMTRFGQLHSKDGVASRFEEKPQLSEGWVNGGFFVMEPRVFEYLSEDAVLEREPLERLTADGQLAVYEHRGYWSAMDTYREAQQLNDEWNSGNPGWLVKP